MKILKKAAMLKHRLRHSQLVKATDRICHKTVARLTILSHADYYSLVSVEAHGTYRYAAGFLALLVAYELLMGEGSGE